MEHLAMCDSSITTSRVCCVTGGQNSLFSIILGVILKCYHLFGLQPPLQASAVVLKTGGASDVWGLSQLTVSTSRRKPSLLRFTSPQFAAWFFFFPCHRRPSPQKAVVWGISLWLPGQTSAAKQLVFLLLWDGGLCGDIPLQGACPGLLCGSTWWPWRRSNDSLCLFSSKRLK